MFTREEFLIRHPEFDHLNIIGIEQKPISMTFNDYIGQINIKENILVKINKFKKSGEPIGHILFLGFAGAGKTTLAKIMAQTMGVMYVEKSAASLMKWDELLILLKGLSDGAVLFLDEIHNLK